MSLQILKKTINGASSQAYQEGTGAPSGGEQQRESQQRPDAHSDAIANNAHTSVILQMAQTN